MLWVKVRRVSISIRYCHSYGFMTDPHVYINICVIIFMTTGINMSVTYFSRMLVSIFFSRLKTFIVIICLFMAIIRHRSGHLNYIFFMYWSSLPLVRREDNIYKCKNTLTSFFCQCLDFHWWLLHNLITPPPPTPGLQENRILFMF